MTLPPFKPKGARSHRDIILDLTSAAPIGQVLKYSALASALGFSRDSEEARQAVRSAVQAARPTLIKRYGRALIAQRGEGYRTALPGELAVVAQKHKKRADRQVGKALAVVTHADTSGMNPAERRVFDATRMLVVNLYHRVNSAEDRIKRLEQAIFGEPPQDVVGDVIEKSDDVPESRSRGNIWD